MGWKPATLRAKLSPQIYPTALWQVQPVRHLSAWQQPPHQTCDLPAIPPSSINYRSSDLHVLHICDGWSPTERRLGKKWIFLSKHLNYSYVSVYTKQIWNYLSGHPLPLDPWKEELLLFSLLRHSSNLNKMRDPTSSLTLQCHPDVSLAAASFDCRNRHAMVEQSMCKGTSM